MATDALRSQVAAKWQDSFTRLNRGQPGITGLMTFSQVRSSTSHPRYDQSRQSIEGLETLYRISTTKGLDGPKPSKEVRYAYSYFDISGVLHYSTTDMEQVRAAFDMVNQCRRLPVMLETFLGE